MSNKTVLIALAVALVLGGIAWLVVRGGSGGAGGNSAAAAGVVKPGERIFTFAPSQVTAVTVRRPGSPEELLRLDPDTGAWTLTIKPAGGAEGPRWPVSRVDSLLRQLSSTLAVAEPQSGMDLGENPTVVALTLTTGQTITFRLAQRTIGGTGLLAIDEIASAPARTEGGAAAASEPARRAVINDEVHKVFTNPGPSAWRDTSALPGVDLQAARVRFQGSSGTLALSRVGPRWTITEPESAAGAPASAEAVKAILTNLGSLKIVEFRDTAAAPIDTPTATITVETDARPAEGEAAKPGSRRELVVGGPCGSGGQQGERRAAMIDGAFPVCIDAGPLATLPFDPAKYLSLRVAEVPAEDIGTVLIEPTGEGAPPEAGRVVRRQLDKWAVLDHQGNETVLADAGAIPINAMLAFLTSPPRDPADAQPSLAAPDGYAPMGRVTMLSIGGSPLESVEIGRGGDGRVAVRTGKVYRSYPADRIPDLFSALLKRTPIPGAPAAPEAPKPPADK